MTIRELAKLANVSVSTVSKVINRKDDSISEETRGRVLNLAKKYNYVPRQPAGRVGSSLLIGVMAGEDADYRLLTGIVRRAQSRGYSTILCSSSSAEQERQNFEILAAHRVDGILWSRSPYSAAALPEALAKSAIKTYTLDSETQTLPGSHCFSYAELGYAAAESLLKLGHKSLGCIATGYGSAVRDFIEGLRRCLFDYQISAENGDLLCKTSDCDYLWLQARTGVICFDAPALHKLAAVAEYRNIRIPAELSVVGVDSDSQRIGDVRVSSLAVPYGEIGGFAVDRLVDDIEARPASHAAFSRNYELSCQDSIAAPQRTELGRFVVIGAVNIDTLLFVDKQLEPGETIIIRRRMTLPGGKGLNQAVGLAKLGGRAALISSVGNDYDARRAFECLKAQAVCVDGVSARDDIPTGHAYIYIQNDAESNIAIFDGANAALSCADISRCEELFEGADFCLIHTELRQSVILHAAKLARKHGARVILKPCAVDSLRPELMRHVDILVPNAKEAELLLPELPTQEERARHFLTQGVGAAIITLGDQGCLVAEGGTVRSYPAARLTPVDTTGAADAFVSALAFYLSLGKDMDEAVKYATCAAGLSTTRHGVPPALVDRETLELYYAGHKGDFNSKE